MRPGNVAVTTPFLSDDHPAELRCSGLDLTEYIKKRVNIFGPLPSG